MTTGKVILSVLAGVAAGATLGVLFAPDKGSSTRKKMVQKRDAYIDELGNKVNDLIDGVAKNFESVKKQAAHLIDRGSAKMEELETEITAATNSKLRR